jgi:hypothetical protein
MNLRQEYNKELQEINSTLIWLVNGYLKKRGYSIQNPL